MQFTENTQIYILEIVINFIDSTKRKTYVFGSIFYF